jgi:hypothetical protein
VELRQSLRCCIHFYLEGVSHAEIGLDKIVAASPPICMISELKRILRLNLTVVSAPHRNTMPKASVRLAAPAASGQIARLHKTKILPSVDSPRPHQPARRDPI